MEDSGEMSDGKLDALSKSLASAGREEACEITRMFIDQIPGNEEENVHYIISNAKHYIDEHLAEDISVSSIATNLYIIPNYFSRLFKQHMKSPLLLTSRKIFLHFPICQTIITIEQSFL